MKVGDRVQIVDPNFHNESYRNQFGTIEFMRPAIDEPGEIFCRVRLDSREIVMIYTYRLRVDQKE